MKYCVLIVLSGVIFSSGVSSKVTYDEAAREEKSRQSGNPSHVHTSGFSSDELFQTGDSKPKHLYRELTFNASPNAQYVGLYADCAISGFKQGSSSDALKEKRLYTQGSPDTQGRLKWYMKNESEYHWQWVKVRCYNYK